MSKRFALLGSGIGYSLSPRLHRLVFDALGVQATYELMDCAPDALPAAVERLCGYDGYNVTKPFKQAIVPYLTRNDSPFDAVNTVVCAGKDRIGYNTDGTGFARHLSTAFPADDLPRSSRVLVLGAGGVAGVAVAVLCSRFDTVHLYNRTPEKAAALASRSGATALCKEQAAQEAARGYDLAVNCTSAGLHGEQALPPQLSGCRLRYAYDMIYHPSVTPFLQQAAAMGARTENGLGMLIWQAIAADELFWNREIPQDMQHRLYNEIRSKL